MVSADVAPPAAITSRWDMGARIQRRLMAPWPSIRAPAIRTGRLPCADCHMQTPNPLCNRLKTGPAAVRNGLGGAPVADSSLTACTCDCNHVERKAAIASFTEVATCIHYVYSRLV